MRNRNKAILSWFREVCQNVQTG